MADFGTHQQWNLAVSFGMMNSLPNFQSGTIRQDINSWKWEMYSIPYPFLYSLWVSFLSRREHGPFLRIASNIFQDV